MSTTAYNPIIIYLNRWFLWLPDTKALIFSSTDNFIISNLHVHVLCIGKILKLTDIAIFTDP